MLHLTYFTNILRAEFSSIKPLTAPVASYDTYISEFPLEISGIQQSIQQEAAGLRQKDLPGFISILQKGMVHIANTICKILGPDFRDMDTITEENTRLNLCKHMYGHLEEIRIFVENFFNRFLDMEINIPQAHHILAVKEIAERIPVLRGQLKEMEVGEDLLKIAFKPFNIFVNEQKTITYRGLIYLQDFLREMTLIVKGETDPDKTAEDQLFDVLCYLNFNSDSFGRYIIAKCERKIAQEPTPEAKLILIIKFEERCESFHLKTQAALWPIEESIKQRISSWLELKKSKLKEILGIAPPPVPGLTQNVILGSTHVPGLTQDPAVIPSSSHVILGLTQDPDYKLPFNLTIGQLAFIIKLLLKLGLISEPVVENIHRFCSRHFLAKNHSPISLHGFRTRFNSPEHYTKSFVKDLFFKLLREI